MNLLKKIKEWLFGKEDDDLPLLPPVETKPLKVIKTNAEKALDAYKQKCKKKRKRRSKIAKLSRRKNRGK